MSAATLTEFRETREESIVASVGRRKGVFGATLAVVVLGGMVATFRATPVYEATTTLVFPLKTNAVLSPAQAAIGTTLGSLGAATPLRQGQFLLESPAATARVARALGLSRTETDKLRRIENNPAANALVVRATNEDPKRAQIICGLYVKALRELTAATGDGGQKGDMKLLDARIAQQDSAVQSAQSALARFQRGLQTSPSLVTSGDSILVVPAPWLEEKRKGELELRSLDARIAARKSNLATAAKMADDPTNLPTVRPLRDRLVQLDLDLRNAASVGGPQSPDVIRLRAEIDTTKVTLRRELDAYLRADRAGVADPDSLGLLIERVSSDARLRSVSRLAEAAPGEAARYQTLLERLSSATSALEKLKAQNVAADLQDDSDPNRWSVLDNAVLAERPVNKSYLQASLVYVPLGLVLASGMACLFDRRRPR